MSAKEKQQCLMLEEITAWLLSRKKKQEKGDYLKYANSNTLETQEDIARFGKSAWHPLCRAALHFWRIDDNSSEQALISQVSRRRDQMRGLIEDFGRTAEKVRNSMANFNKEGRKSEAEQASAVLRKANEHLRTAMEIHQAAVEWIAKSNAASHKARQTALDEFNREHEAAKRLHNVKALRALQRVKKRWNNKKAFLGDTDRRTLEILTMLRGKAREAAMAKEGTVGAYLEIAQGGHRALSDEVWQGVLTAKEIKLRLVDAPDAEDAKEVRRLAKKLGIKLAEDQRGRRQKPLPVKKAPQRRRGRPPSKPGLEYTHNVEVRETMEVQARGGQTPVRGGTH